MKRLLAVILWLAFSTSAMAASLQWDRNAATDAIVKYPVYQAPGATGPFIKIGETLDSTCSATTCTFTLPALTAGVYFFYVTAAPLVGESGPSNKVSWGAPSPKNLIIVLTIAPDGTVTFRLMDPQDFFQS